MKIAILVVSVMFVASLEAKHHKHHVEKKDGAIQEKDGQHHQHKKLVMGKKHRPLGRSPDTVYKAAWMKIANFHKADKSACKDLACMKKEICMVNAETKEAECMSKKVVRQRKMQRKLKMRKSSETEDRDQALDHKHQGKQLSFKKKSRELKEKAKKYHTKYEKKMRNKLQHIKVAFDYLDEPQEDKRQKKEVNDLSLYSNSLEKPMKDCSQKELNEMGRRLLDWFKLLQDENKTSHHKEKRNSKKKELHEDGECICQAPVSWQYLQLDTNVDGQLDIRELRAIESNGYEHCVSPFIEACDHDKDTMLSEREWCCCFADILPPCMAAQKKVPAEMINGTLVILPGAHVPLCDEDGFFQEHQCHSSTGYCWCVDRNGHEVAGTRSLGMPECEKDTHKRRQHKSKL